MNPLALIHIFRRITFFSQLAVLLLSLFFLLPTPINASVIIQRPLYIGLTDGLVGFWSFDGPTVSTNATQMKVNDLSGQGNQSTASGSLIPTRVAGKIGQALEFDHNNDEIDITDYNPNGANFSVGGWMKMRAGTGSENGPIIGNSQNT